MKCEVLSAIGDVGLGDTEAGICLKASFDRLWK